MLASLIILIISVLQGIYASEPRCLNAGHDNLVFIRGASDAKCHLLKSKTECLNRYGTAPIADSEYEQSRPSCVWHHLADTKLLEAIRFTSLGSNAMQSRFINGPGRLKFRGTLCRLVVTATLPPSSQDKYGAYISLEGGPRYTIEYDTTDMSEPGRDASIMGCTISPNSSSRSCRLIIMPPAGFAKDIRFMNNSLTVDFFVTDQSRIDQLKTDHQLTPKNRMTIDINYSWNRCPAAVLASVDSTTVPIVDDTVIFGPTDFSLKGLPLYTSMRQYYMVSYRTYTVRDVTDLEWKVDVGPSLDDPPKNATDLTVFLAQQRPGFYFGFDCNDRDPEDTDVCIPPRDFRVKGTPVCVGTECSGSVKGLDAKLEYVLFVSYPTYRDPAQYQLSFAREKTVSPYATEEVHVRMWARAWKLGKLQGRALDEPGDYDL